MKSDIKNTLFIAFATICLLLTLLWIGYTVNHAESEDFRVFYESAKVALNGNSIYRTYGPIELPYWYFPWLAWFYIPLAFFPHEIAYALYITISILCAFITINYLARRVIPPSSIWETIFIYSMSLMLCWLLFMVGQMDFILLAVAVMMIYFIDINKSIAAGLLVPVLLFKPHLFLLFLPYALFKGKKGFFVSSMLVSLLLIIISFIIIPDWPLQMLRLLSESGNRTDNNWNFTTLPNMLGMQENWSGTANIPITLFLILAGFVAIWKVRTLQTLPLLSLALAGSLFCAPRAYAYNLPMLIPALIWLSGSLPKRFLLLFWLTVGTLPFLFRFSSGTYSIVLVIFTIGVVKAHKTLAGVNPRLQTTTMDIHER